MRAKIIGTGSYLPEKILTNDDLAQMVDTSDDWIRTRTGIEHRHIASGEETTTFMAAEAARRALENAGMTADELELIIVATVSADTLVPSTACGVQKELGAANAVAFDIGAACSGFVFALNTADAYFQIGAYKNALLIGVETLSKITNWEDRSTCILFADGAGAAIVKADETGMMACIQGSNGAKKDVIIVNSRSLHNPFSPEFEPMDFLYMNGPEVFKFAVKTVPECIKKTLAKADLTPQDIDLFILHQANMRINQSISKKLNIPIEKFPANVNRCGNTSAASIPILLDEVNCKGMLHPGDKVVLAGFGAGVTWGSAVLTW